MNKLSKAALLAAALAAAHTANAGVSNAFTFASPTVTPVSDQVTYATAQPPLITYVGYDVGNVASNVLVTNTSGNTVNKFVLRFTATVVKPDGASQETLQGLSITSTSSACAFETANPANSVTVVCQVQQLKNGDTFPAFTVFFLAPSMADSPEGCAGSNTPLTACNTVKTQIDLIYSEGTNDAPTGLPNSTQTYLETDELRIVSLGTANPSFVKSALPKGLSNAKIFTGSGVPMAGATGEFKEFTESIALQPIPSAYRYGQASIKVRGEDENASADGQCINLRNFRTCPLYETTIVDPSTTFPTTITFPATPLQFLYRIDASMLRRPISQIVNNTLIYYSETGTSWSSNDLVPPCDMPGQLNTPGKACIDMRPDYAPRCFRNLQSTPGGNTADLVGDCQWYLLKDGNGFVKFN